LNLAVQNFIDVAELLWGAAFVCTNKLQFRQFLTTRRSLIQSSFFRLIKYYENKLFKSFLNLSQTS
jgi:hypothetical protein